jgi:predicted nucleic acid-binding protein
MLDPSDGFITATALLNGATFVTTDDRILTGGHAAAARCRPREP